jgi:nitrogen fixation-related uncharacterized protein
MSITGIILFCIIIVWIYVIKNQKYEHPKQIEWEILDWNEMPTPKQEKTINNKGK